MLNVLCKYDDVYLVNVDGKNSMYSYVQLKDYTGDTNFYIRNNSIVLKQGTLCRLKKGVLNYTTHTLNTCRTVNIVDVFFNKIVYTINYNDCDLLKMLQQIMGVIQITDYKIRTRDTVIDILDLSTGVKALLIAFWAKQTGSFICLNTDECGLNVLNCLYPLSCTFPIILYSTLSKPIYDTNKMYEVL